MERKTDEEIISTVFSEEQLKRLNGDTIFEDVRVLITTTVISTYRLAEQEALDLQRVNELQTVKIVELERELSEAHKAYDKLCNSLTIASEEKGILQSRHNSMVERIKGLKHHGWDKEYIASSDIETILAEDK